VTVGPTSKCWHRTGRRVIESRSIRSSRGQGPRHHPRKGRRGG